MEDKLMEDEVTIFYLLTGKKFTPEEILSAINGAGMEIERLPIGMYHERENDARDIKEAMTWIAKLFPEIKLDSSHTAVFYLAMYVSYLHPNIITRKNHEQFNRK